MLSGPGITLAIAGAMNTPTILLGAFDRHNFGDLLFPISPPPCRPVAG